MKEYHKIEGLFKRDEETKQLMPGVFRNEAVDLLQGCQWEFTEKIDGTNIRIHWDGHSVSIAGRTDKAIIPARLLTYLQETFCGDVNEQVFEEHFADKEVTLYGEGYGAKIQNGGNYRPDNAFILFDVEINGAFLARKDVCDIARYFGVDAVPIVLQGTIAQAIEFVKQRPKSTIGTADMEGVVGRPLVELCDRRGNRIIVKIKARDMQEIERGKQQ